MNVPESIKAAAWGIIGGAIAAMVIGFSWGGWVTRGTALEMETASAATAVVQAFALLCMTKAEQKPGKLVAMKEESRWQRGDFVAEASWVDNVSEKDGVEVAKACASTLAESMKAH